MFPPILGLLILFAALGLVLLGFGLTVVGAVRGRGARTGLALAGGGVVGYALLWLLGFVTAESRVLDPGQEVHFCGLDCHLHVSVARVSHEAGLGVTLRFRSDAKRALEYPSFLRYEIVDETGRRYRPSDGMVSAPLPAGETVEHEIRFSVPGEASHPRLVVFYDSLMDYLVPGRANPLAQRKIRFDLDRS